MGQKMISQKVERVCEGCGQTFIYELVDALPEVTKEFTSWYVVLRELVNPISGESVPMKSMAHSIECIPTAALKLQLEADKIIARFDAALAQMEKQENETVVDIDSLRAGKRTVN